MLCGPHRSCFDSSAFKESFKYELCIMFKGVIFAELQASAGSIILLDKSHRTSTQAKTFNRNEDFELRKEDAGRNKTLETTT